jgi:hypothetical protein
VNANASTPCPLLTMRYSFFLAGLLCGSAITALENPHRRAPSRLAKREAIETKNAPRKRDTALYLNSKTARMQRTMKCTQENNTDIHQSICCERERDPGCRLQHWRVVRRNLIDQLECEQPKCTLVLVLSLRKSGSIGRNHSVA